MDESIINHLPRGYKKLYEICLESGIDLDKLDSEKIKKNDVKEKNERKKFS